MTNCKTFAAITTLALCLALAACQTAPQRPTFYPNNHLAAVSDEQAQNDIDACMALAENSGVQEKQDGKAGKKAAKGATLGAITAGAWGLVRGGDAGERALAGAAAGGAGGAASGAFDANNTNPMYKSFVQKCLADQGYEIIGWQ